MSCKSCRRGFPLLVSYMLFTKILYPPLDVMQYISPCSTIPLPHFKFYYNKTSFVKAGTCHLVSINECTVSWNGTCHPNIIPPSQVVDHTNPEEELQFHDLVSSVFNSTSTQDTHTLRSELFDTLMEYFPDRMSQPKENLTDYVPPVWRRSVTSYLVTS